MSRKHVEVKNKDDHFDIITEYMCDSFSQNCNTSSDSNGLLYSTTPHQQIDDSNTIIDAFLNIRDKLPEDEETVEDFCERSVDCSDSNMGTDIRQQPIAIGTGVKESQTAPPDLIGLRGRDKIDWIELSLPQIIQLQAIGVFDRLTNVSPYDNEPFFTPRYPILVFKIKASCVFFSSEIPTMNKPMGDLSTLTTKNVETFNKWAMSNSPSSDIKVWYSLQNSSIDKLFVGGKFVDQHNISIRYWHVGGLLYQTAHNATLTNKLPTVVQISNKLIGRNLLKKDNPDDPIFATTFNLTSTSFNKIVTAFIVDLLAKTDAAAIELGEDRTKPNGKIFEDLLLSRILNLNYETNDFNDILTSDDVIDPIVRVHAIHSVHNDIISKFKKALVVAKKQNNINSNLIRNTINALPIEIENNTNLLSNQFDF